MNLKEKIDTFYQESNDIGDILKKKHKNYNIEKDIVNNQIIITNNKNKVILKFYYYFVGSYDIDHSLWIWTINNFLLDKKHKSYVKDLMNFKENFKNNFDKYKKTPTEYFEKYLYYLSNDVCYIKSSNILDIMKLNMYILKGVGTFSEITTDNNINKINLYIIRSINLNNI